MTLLLSSAANTPAPTATPTKTTTKNPTTTTVVATHALTPNRLRQLQRGLTSVAFRSLNRFTGRWTPYPFNFTASTTMAPSNGTKSASTTKATPAAATASKPAFLTLPVLETLSPLTEGTNLPPVILDPSPPASSHSDKASPTTEADKTTTTSTAAQVTSPPLSPTSPTSPSRPGSVRRFLSRVSLNSSYNASEGRDVDSVSVMSKPPMSPTASMHSGNIARSASKKGGSWWRRSKSSSSNGAQEQRPPVRAITPPPTLPEVKPQESSFDTDDIFKSLK